MRVQIITTKVVREKDIQNTIQKISISNFENHTKVLAKQESKKKPLELQQAVISIDLGHKEERTTLPRMTDEVERSLAEQLEDSQEFGAKHANESYMIWKKICLDNLWCTENTPIQDNDWLNFHEKMLTVELFRR